MSDAHPSTLEFDVRGYDCGYGGPLGAFSLANFLQEAAGVNADALGFGMEAMDARKWTWMLSRLDVRIDGLPRAGERVSVLTWPAEIRKLFALRDFVMRGSDGRSLVRAVYAYLVVDLAARRPLRPASVFGENPPSVAEAHPVPDFAFDIPASLDARPSFAQSVCARHIDHNGHANNAHIINWLVDASTGAVPQAAPSSPGRDAGTLSALRVEFLAEALEGDELAASRGRPESSPFAPEATTSSTVAELSRGDAKVARALVGRR
jgi:medium-chain acyl-[acyl-carrier-protein] hydrolase